MKKSVKKLWRECKIRDGWWSGGRLFHAHVLDSREFTTC